MESPSFLPTITDNLKNMIRAIQDVNIIVKETGSKTLNIDNRLVMYVYLRFNIYSVNSDISCG